MIGCLATGIGEGGVVIFLFISFCVCVTFHLTYIAPYLSLLQTLLTSPSPFVPPTLTPYLSPHPHPLTPSPSLISCPTRGNGTADLFNLWVVVLKCSPPVGGKGSSTFTQPAAHIFHSICTSQASVSCSGWLEAGFYVVIPFSFIAWQDGHEAPPSTHRKATEGLQRSKDYFLSVFSSRPLILDKVHLRPGFVAQAIHLLAKKVGKRIEVSI